MQEINNKKLTGLFHIKLNHLMIPWETEVQQVRSNVFKRQKNIDIQKGDEIEIKVEIQEPDKNEWIIQAPPKRVHKSETFKLVIPDNFDGQNLQLDCPQKYGNENVLAFECYIEDKINIKLYRRKKKVMYGRREEIYEGFCFFPIKKLVELPNITHQLQVKLVRPEIDRKIQKIGFLDLNVNFCKQKIGYLKIKVKQCKIHQDVIKKHSSWDSYVLIIGEDGQVFKTKSIQSENPVWNYEQKIMFDQFFTKLKFRFNLDSSFIDQKIGVRVIDMVEEGMMKITDENVKKQIYLESTKSGNSVKKEIIGVLLIESRFFFDFDSSE